MSFTDLPLYLWGYTLLSVIHLLNRVPSKSIPTAPYEIWFGKKSSLGYFKTWGCPAYVKRQMANKLEDRSIIACFIGYPKESIRYYYFPQDHNMIVSRNVIFLENSLSRMVVVGGQLSSKRMSLKSQELQILRNPLSMSQQLMFLYHLVDLAGSSNLLKGIWVCLQRK